MANHLTMALIDTIRSLHTRGWSARRIARELNIHRTTVARYLQTPHDPDNPTLAPHSAACVPSEAKPALAPFGSDLSDAQAKPALAPSGSNAVAGDSSSSPQGTPLAPGPLLSGGAGHRGPGRPSDCLPFRDFILAKLDQGLSAQRIFQDLADDHAYSGSYYSVRRFVQRLQQGSPLPFRRMECGPGEEAQVDFGLGAPLSDGNGKRCRPHVLRLVLSHSRKAYSEVLLRQTTDAFLLAVENALWTFGGVMERLVLDNLRAAVSRADWFDPDLNPKVRSFAEYYGFALMPTRPYMPRHKGKVERGVDYVQENALKGRSFASLQEQNAYLRHWEETVADTRVHGTTRQQVGKHFQEVERPALRSLPAERFPSFAEGRRTVQRDGYIEVARAYYSVPPEYLARRVWVRWDGRLVRIYNDRLEQVALHVQQPAGSFSSQRNHIPAEKISGAERGPVWLLAQIGKVGDQAVRWAQAVLQSRGVEGVRVLQGLLALAGRHDAARLNQACGIALSYGEYRLPTVRALLGQATAKPEPEPLIQEHPLIRPLADYQQLLHDTFPKEELP
jgi:transposase